MKKCSGCKLARYCSSRCQKNDWDIQHREVCNDIDQVDSDETMSSYVNLGETSEYEPESRSEIQDLNSRDY
jgi:hypothetical protein